MTRTDGPVVVAELRSLFHETVGGPDKTILHSAARHDSGRVRIVPFFLVPEGDSVPGLHRLAEAAGVEPVIVPDRGRFDLRAPGDLRRRMLEHGCHVVHTHDYKTDLLGRWARRGTGLRLMATAHGWSAPTDRKLAVYNAVDLRVLRGFPTVLAVSASIRDRLLAGGVPSERVRVLHNAVDTDHWRPASGQIPRPEGLPRGGRVVGTVCRLSADKDVEGLVAAFAALAPAVPDTTLVVAGDGPRRGDLEAAARATGLGDRIRFLGRRTDVLDLYRSFDVFVLASRTEGLPNSVLEAMATGCPVVAHSVGGVPELVEDGRSGRLVPPGDVSALGSALRAVLEDPDAAGTLSRAARERAETLFSFRRRVRILEGIYETVRREGRA